MPKKGYKQTEEHRDKISEATKGENNPMYGISLLHTKERRWRNADHILSEEEENGMMFLYKKGLKVRELVNKYGCSSVLVIDLLKKMLGYLEYTKISKENRQNASKENIKVAYKTEHKEFTSNQLESVRKNIKKAHESLSDFRWISNPEHLFYLKCLTKLFPLRFVKRQFYLKGLNHSFDFALPKFKILIEIDGDYFHSLPGKKERDVEINEFVYRTYPDWILIRYSDNDLKRMDIL